MRTIIHLLLVYNVLVLSILCIVQLHARVELHYKGRLTLSLFKLGAHVVGGYMDYKVLLEEALCLAFIQFCYLCNHYTASR